MKDKFFKIVDKIYIKIYCLVNGFVYFIFSRKRTKKLSSLSRQEKLEIKKYWKKYRRIGLNINEYKWFRSKNKFDKRIIPESIWHSDIEPHFNNVFLEKAFQDKNYYEFLIGKKNSPSTIIHCINGQLLNEKYDAINTNEAMDIVNTQDEVICKPSVGSGGGRSIKFIKEAMSLQDINNMIEYYSGNFLIQKIIKQHKFIASFNEDSVNTMRIITFLFKGEVHFIYGELRFVSKGSRLDNSAAGGDWVLINKDGTLQKEFYKYDKNTTDMFVDKNIDLKVNRKMKVPNWDEVLKLVKKTHYRLSHFGIVYWDVTILENETPIIVEYNLLDSDAYAYQYGVGPFFGDLTDDVLNEIYLKRS